MALRHFLKKKENKSIFVQQENKIWLTLEMKHRKTITRSDQDINEISFLDTQVSLAPTHVRLSVGHTFGFPISGRPSVKREA